MPKLYFFPFALLIWLFTCSLKTPDNQIEYTNSLCWIFWVALHFSIAGTWMKDNRADSTAIAFHLPLLEGWVVVVTLYPEPSSLGTCYDKFARCSLFSVFFRSYKQRSRTEFKIWYILSVITYGFKCLEQWWGRCLCSPLSCLSWSFGQKF